MGFPATTTRRTLLARVRDLDDQASWREFDEQYRELILRYAQRRGLQAADAEDVRQVVMETLARRMRTFEYRPERGGFRRYLGTVVRHAISKHRMRQERRREVLEVDGGTMADPLANEDEAWEHEWMLHHYRLALARVRETFQPASLEVFEGLMAGRSVGQLADACGMTPEAVYKVKQRIRERLSDLITHQIREEG